MAFKETFKEAFKEAFIVGLSWFSIIWSFFLEKCSHIFIQFNNSLCFCLLYFCHESLSLPLFLVLDRLWWLISLSYPSPIEEERETERATPAVKLSVFCPLACKPQKEEGRARGSEEPALQERDPHSNYKVLLLSSLPCIPLTKENKIKMGLPQLALGERDDPHSNLRIFYSLHSYNTTTLGSRKRGEIVRWKMKMKQHIMWISCHPQVKSEREREREKETRTRLSLS